MKKFFYLFACLLIMNIFPSAFAQQPTQSDFEAIHAEVGHMIERFERNVAYIGSKNSGETGKDTYIKSTLRLFIGDGKEYTDSYGNTWPAPHMQVSSTRTTTPINRTIPDYLNRLRGLTYAKVQITSADHYTLTNIYKVGDHYEAVATIYQKFCGYYSDGLRRYCDVTQKSIRVYIERITEYEGTRWKIRFGDIDVIDTQKQ